MCYEVWGRSIEEKKYVQLSCFTNKDSIYSEMDKVNKERYTDIIVVKTEWQQPSELVAYKELKKTLKK